MTTYSAKVLSERTQALIAALDASLREGLLDAGNQTNDAAVANLSGSRSDVPWSYPVPVRHPSGLRSKQKMQIESATALYVLNTSAYANAISTGNVSSWAGRGKHKMITIFARPFVDDAVASVQPAMVIQRHVEGALNAWT